MEIAFLIAHEGTHPGGGDRVIYEYANGLARRGHTVHLVHVASLFALKEPRNLRQRMRPLRYIPYALRGNWKPDSWFKLDPAIKLHWIPVFSKAFLPRVDAYVATWWTTAEHLNATRDLPGRRLYLIQHLETWGGPKDEVMATWKAPLEKIVIARWLEDIARNLGETSHYIPNGLNFANFGCDVAPEDRDPAQFAMLFNERIPWKGSADGVEALSKLREKYPQVKAELFGVFERFKDLPSWITYHHQPAQEELRRIYNRASIFLAPSHTEGWGLPPCEAMMCGAAVVATNIGGHQEFCVDERNALLAAAKNPGRLAEVAARLIEDQQLRLRLAKTGNRDIQRFTWDAAVDAFDRVLKSAPAIVPPRPGVNQNPSPRFGPG
jgi:glycosyltransferase involved in cell wall biosynthesis